MHFICRKVKLLSHLLVQFNLVEKEHLEKEKESKNTDHKKSIARLVNNEAVESESDNFSFDCLKDY